MDRKSRYPLKSLLLAIILVIIAFFPVWKGLVGVWATTERYSHGFLILPISGYLVWQKRKLLAKLESGPSRLGLPALLLTLTIYVFGIFAGVETMASLSLVLFLGSAILYLFGLAVLRNLLFPLLFLLFMIPVPDQIYTSLTVPLQLLVSWSSVLLSKLMGVPLVVDGNLIHLPEKTLQVVDACSGLRSMMTLLALSSLIWYLTLKSKLLGAVVLISAVPVAVLINILRVTLVILSLWYLNLDVSGGILHTILGLAVNLLALLMILSLRGVLSKWEPASPKG